MKIVSFILNFIASQKQISKRRQAPELPEELLRKIFSNMTITEVSRIRQSCKDWSKYTSRYLEPLKEKVMILCETCENNCFIPADASSGLVNYIFACHLRDNKIIVEKPSNLDPDFYINADIKALDLPFEDSALEKKFKTFFCSGRWIDFACTILKNVQSFDLKNNLDQTQRERILAIHNAMNLYLKYQQSQ